MFKTGQSDCCHPVLLLKVNVFEASVITVLKEASDRPITFSFVIIYMKKSLESDWLRALPFKCSISAKTVTPV